MIFLARSSSEVDTVQPAKNSKCKNNSFFYQLSTPLQRYYKKKKMPSAKWMSRALWSLPPSPHSVYMKIMMGRAILWNCGVFQSFSCSIWQVQIWLPGMLYEYKFQNARKWAAKIGQVATEWTQKVKWCAKKSREKQLVVTHKAGGFKNSWPKQSETLR